MNFIRANWSKISTGLLVVTLGLTGAAAARQYLSDDCCAPGASCCHPGSPCCKGHAHASAH